MDSMIRRRSVFRPSELAILIYGSAIKTFRKMMKTKREANSNLR